MKKLLVLVTIVVSLLTTSAFADEQPLSFDGQEIPNYMYEMTNKEYYNTKLQKLENNRNIIEKDTSVTSLVVNPDGTFSTNVVKQGVVTKPSTAQITEAKADLSEVFVRIGGKIPIING